MTTSSELNAAAPVRIGVVGLGRFGHLHAATLAALGEAQLVALVDTDAPTLAAVSAAYPQAGVWPELTRALDQSSAEAWVIAASSTAHVSLARQVLMAGRAALVEKPLATSLAEAQSLAPLVAPDSANLMVGHILLFASEVRELLAQAARRGVPRLIDSVRHRPQSTVAAYPGESPFELTMVHDLSIVQVMLGGAEPDAFSAQQGCRADGACDLAQAQLRWRGGATLATLSASFLTPLGMADDGFDRLEVFGDGWSARIDSNPRPLQIWDQRARWPLGLDIGRDEAATSGMLAEQLRAFCRVVRGRTSVPSGSDYFAAVQLCRWLEQLRGSSGG